MGRLYRETLLWTCRAECSVQNMPWNKNERREFEEEEINEAELHLARQMIESDYWDDVKLKHKAVLAAIQDGALTPKQIRFFRRELKKMEN